MSNLHDLKSRLDAARNKNDEGHIPDGTKGERAMDGMALGMRILTEMIGAILVAGFIGYMLDKWLGSAPWLLLVFCLLGFITAIFNLLKFLNGYSGGVGYKSLQKETEDATKGASETDDR